MSLTTGGRACGATSTRSSPCSRANCMACSTRTIPTCSPFGPTRRTSGTRIRSLMRGSVLMLPPRTRILVDRDNRDSWPDCAHVHNAKDRPSQDRQKGSCRCRSLTQNCLRRRMSTRSSQHVLTTGHEPGRNSELLAVTSSARVGDQASTSTDHLAAGHAESIEQLGLGTKSLPQDRGSVPHASQ